MDISLLRSKFDDLCIIPYAIQIAVVFKVIVKGLVYSHSQCLCGIFYNFKRYFEKQTREVWHSVSSFLGLVYWTSQRSTSFSRYPTQCSSKGPLFILDGIPPVSPVNLPSLTFCFSLCGTSSHSLQTVLGFSSGEKSGRNLINVKLCQSLVKSRLPSQTGKPWKITVHQKNLDNGFIPRKARWDLKVHSHLATTTRTFYVVNTTYGLYACQCFCSHMTTDKNDKNSPLS